MFSYINNVAKYKFKITNKPNVEIRIDEFLKLPKVNEILEFYRERNKIPKAIFNKMMENFNKENSKIIEKSLDKISKFKIYYLYRLYFGQF